MPNAPRIFKRLSELLDTTGQTGYIYLTAGTASFVTAIPAAKGGTGLDTSGSTGFFKVTAGTWSVENASTFRTSIGLAIGSNVQAWDTDLDSWAAVTRGTGFDAFAADGTATNLRAILSSATGTSANRTGSGAVVFAVAPTFTGSTAMVDLTITGDLTASTLNKTITLSPTGTGSVTIAPGAAITLTSGSAGAINNMTIGQATPLAGSFTTLGASGAITDTQNAIGAASVVGLNFVNGTTSTNGNNQWAPSLQFRGTGWGVTAGSSLYADAQIVCEAISVSNVVQPFLTFFGRVNSTGTGAFTDSASINCSNGQFSGSTGAFGLIRVGSYVSASSFTTNSVISSPSSAVIALFDSSAASFTGRLTFGGTTSSFPALARSSTTLQVKLADGSADAPLSASNITASGTLTVAGALIGTPDALAPALNASGAVSVTTPSTAFALNGVNALSLANGTNGQIKTITCTAVTAAGTGTISPTTTNGYTTIAFTAAGQAVVIQYHTTGGWAVLSNRNATIA